MSYAPPEQCSWVTSCKTYDCEKTGGCLTVHLTDGPTGNSHKMRTRYTVQVGSTIIPIVKTDRDFSVTYSQQFGDPGRPESMFINANNDFQALVCNEYPANKPTCRVAEDCIIETSTLHYVDQRYGVCLYRTIKDVLKFDITSSEMASFKGVWGQIPAHQVKITKNNFTCTRNEKWVLVVKDMTKTLATRTVNLSPFQELVPGSDYYDSMFPTFRPDPSVRQLLLFPQPPSMAIPWTPEIRAYGFYDYSTPEGMESALNRDDGGEKDMFYPEWCRSLTPDPIWKTAAERRYTISWFHSDLTTPSPAYAPVAYTPPAVSVDPIPRGTFAKHPIVGAVYQFLVNEAYGSVVETSPDLNSLIDEALGDELNTHDTTLYYPIGVT